MGGVYNYLPQLPNQQYPDPNSIYGYGYGPYSANGAPIANASAAGGGSVAWGNAIAQGGPDVDPNASISNITSANRNQINNTGNAIGAEGGNELNYYGGLQQQYTGQENSALNALAQQPGYSPAQASQINADYSQFNTTPDQYAAITGDPNAPVQNLEQGVNAEGQFLNAYQGDLGAQLGAYQQNLGSASNQFSTNVGGAATGLTSGVQGAESGLNTGLNAAQSQFSGLNTAVNNPELAFDPNNTEQQMTDAQVQQMVTAAGTSAGNQFTNAQDQLRQQAAAEGNTSPAAIAAMNQQLVTQEAATAGDVETQAAIAAQQAQFQRAQSIEQQREGATQTQAGMQATASTTEEAAAQAAAGLSGQQQIAAEENIGGQNINAQEAIGGEQFNAANLAGQQNISGVNTYGQFSTGQANTMTGQNYNAQSTAEQLASQRAQQNAQMQYSQGTGSQQLTGQGAATVGNANIAGQNTYLNALQNQGAQAQQGAATAQQTQLRRNNIAPRTLAESVNLSGAPLAGFTEWRLRFPGVG